MFYLLRCSLHEQKGCRVVSHSGIEDQGAWMGATSDRVLLKQNLREGVREEREEEKQDQEQTDLEKYLEPLFE
jgi:hypothetical protein